MHTVQRLASRIVLALALLAPLVGLVAAPAAVARPGDDAGQLSAGRVVNLPLLGTVAPPPAPNPVIADLTIRPVPLREVQRGNTLSVEYRFRNDAAQRATASFSLLYPSRLLSFIQLDAPNDRYLSHNATQVTIEVRNVAPGETRTGRINFLVFATAATGSRIGLYAEYTCRNGQICQSNFAEVEVIPNAEEGSSGGTFTMTVSPDRGPPGTAHTFFGSRFRPGETFVTWLNTPSGVQPLSITGRADSAGRIQFTFGTGQITQAGFYSMVAHGQQSNVENVGPFIVQIGGQPAAFTAGIARAAAAAPQPAAGPMAAPTQTSGEGGLAGRVVDGSGAGLAGVPIEVRGVAGELAAVARSRADGDFLVPTGLASGDYLVTARPSLNPELALYAAATTGPVAVSAPDLTPGVSLTLPAAGGLSGRVLGGGAPLAGVRVAALDAGGDAVATDYTDATGVYSVTHLPAGSYTLDFDPQAVARAGLYAEGQLPGQVVTVGAISNVDDVTLAASASTGVIAGTVSDAASGAGIGDVLVVITRAEAPQGETFVSIARTSADGSYSSDPLDPGDYRVQFVTLFSELAETRAYAGEFYNDAPSFAESDAVSVSAGTPTAADAALAAGGSIAGTVSGDGSGPLAEVLVAAFDGDGIPRAISHTDAAGSYTLAGLRAGSYTLRAFSSLSTSSTARGFFDGGYDTTPATPELTPVDLAAGAALTGIDITLGRGPQIVGTVSAGDTGQPLAQVLVVFISNPGPSPSIAGIARTDAEGRYASPALASGPYTIWFTTIFATDPTTHTYQDEFFNNRPTLASADTLIVGRALAPIIRNVDLSPGGAVGGLVTGQSSGAGLPGVAVIATVSDTLVGATVTDEAGRYFLEGLPEGTVTLSVDPDRSPRPVVRSYAGTSITVEITVGATATRDVVLAAE